MSDGMSKMGVTNLGSVEASSPVARRRFLDLNNEVVECRVCPRLVKYRESVARVKKKQVLNWKYWGRPVPGFGDISATIVVIGLAPAPHGGSRNRKGLTKGKNSGFLVQGLLPAGNSNMCHSVYCESGCGLLPCVPT